MPWELTTDIGISYGEHYQTTVHKPAGFKADPGGSGKLTATESADKKTYKLPYKVQSGAKASMDVWNLGVEKSGSPSRNVTVRALVRTANKGEDTPTVADGEGGGSGSGGPRFTVSFDLPTLIR